MSGRLRLLAASLGLVFLVSHLGLLPPTLEDIDSVNFALGVEDFDVWRHRPHPPGYPVYIAMAKASTAAVGVVASGWDRDRRAAAGLAVWGVVAGALAAYVITSLWVALGLSPAASLFAAVVALTSPLFWFTAARPLTDTVALAAAVAVQVWLIRALRAPDDSPGLRRGVLVAAFAAGLLIGVRTQTFWLTAPLLAWLLLARVQRGAHRQVFLLVAAAAGGSLIWAIPLVVVSGGLGSYLRLLSIQGGEDFAGVAMLATKPSGGLFRFAMERTFIAPWIEQTLAHTVLGLALIGIVRLARSHRRALALLTAGYVPALVFHLAFHETETVRYALPFVVPVAGLAVAALTWAGRWVAVTGTVVFASVSLVIVGPRLQAYAESGWPIFRAFQAMHAALPEAGAAPSLKMHHQVWWGVQRPIVWYQPVWDVGPQPFPGDHEWLAIVDHWRTGRTNPIWFLGETDRHDLDLIDWRARERRGRFTPDPAVRDLIGGARLDSMTWTAIGQPDWMLGRGWSLTPEIAGMTASEDRGSASVTAEGFLRRQQGPATIILGGRSIRGSLPAAIVVQIDGRVIAEWPIVGDPKWFVHWLELPDGVPAGEGTYASFAVRVRTDGAPSHEVVFEQFDLASHDELAFSLESGWHELEHNPATGSQWRWSSDHSTLRVRAGVESVNLTLAGESPMKYFDAAPTVTIRVGTREVGRFAPADDFLETIPLDRNLLETSGGLVTVEVDRVYGTGGARGDD